MSTLQRTGNPYVENDTYHIGDKLGDKVVALRAALQCTGPARPDNMARVKEFHDAFHTWLKQARLGDDEHRNARRSLLIDLTYKQELADIVRGTELTPKEAVDMLDVMATWVA